MFKCCKGSLVHTHMNTHTNTKMCKQPQWFVRLNYSETAVFSSNNWSSKSSNCSKQTNHTGWNEHITLALANTHLLSVIKLLAIANSWDFFRTGYWQLKICCLSFSFYQCAVICELQFSIHCCMHCSISQNIHLNVLATAKLHYF